MPPLDDHTEAAPPVASSHRVRRVETVKLIARAWEAAGVSVRCELCGRPDWSLVATAGSEGLALPLRQGSEVRLDRCYLAYAVQCDHCGNVRIMSKTRIEELAAGDDDRDK